MKQQRKNKHLLPAILTVLAILGSLLAILPARSVAAADVTAYPAQAVHFGAYTTNRNLNNAGSAANTQKVAEPIQRTGVLTMFLPACTRLSVWLTASI